MEALFYLEINMWIQILQKLALIRYNWNMHKSPSVIIASNVLLQNH